MNAEFLLQAMGLLDDDLVEEALQPAAPRPSLLTQARRWVSMAACLALLLTAGYLVTHLGMGGGSSGSASTSAGGSAPSTGTSPDGAAGGNGSGSAAGAAEPQEEGTIFLANQVYCLTGETVSELPAGAAPLGQLSALYPDAPSPSTDREEYVGCSVFQSTDGAQLYVQRDDGLWAVAALAEP